MRHKSVHTDSDPAVVRVALYTRVSTEEQAVEGQSLEAQLRALRHYASDKRMVVVAEYVDEGFSATTDQRPQFQAMISSARRKPRPFDIILVHKTDRFSRNLEHAVVYKNLLRRDYGIDVVSILEPFEDSPQGRMMERFMEVIAEYYSDNLAQEVKKGLSEKALTGATLGRPPFGYRIGQESRLESVPELAPVVRWIFASCDQGQPIRAIARTLREQGVEMFGPAVSAFTWAGQTVAGILHNEAYIGTRIWNRRHAKRRQAWRDPSEWVTVEDAHEALIDKVLFDRIQRKLEQNRTGKRSKYGEYLLRGLVRCGSCGGNMVFMRAQTGANRKGVRQSYDILICSRYAAGSDRHLCYRNTAKVAWLEEQILHVLEQVLGGVADPSAYEWSVGEDILSRRQQLTRALEAIDQKFKRQLQAFEAGVLDLDELRQAKERVEAERGQIKAEMTALNGQARKVIPPAEIRKRVQKAMTAISDPSSGTIEARRSALQAVVDQVSWDKRTASLRVRLRAES